VPGLRFEQVQPASDEATLRDWQHIHNLIIPADLSGSRGRSKDPGVIVRDIPNFTALLGVMQ